MLNSSTMDSSVDFVLPDLASSPVKMNKSRVLPPRPAVVETSLASLDDSLQMIGVDKVNLATNVIEKPTIKQKKAYLTAEGKIDVKTMREGKAKSDKLYVGSKALLKKVSRKFIVFHSLFFIKKNVLMRVIDNFFQGSLSGLSFIARGDGFEEFSVFF